MTYPVFEIRKLIYQFRNIDDSLAMETGHRYVSFLFTLLNRAVKILKQVNGKHNSLNSNL
jgi:hypothetical protein